MLTKSTFRNGVLHLVYSDAKSLCQAFCRFQEHYENPEFGGKVFTLGQLRDWYKKTRGEWTYYDDWAGFNIPGEAFTAFAEGLFDPMTEAEEEILSKVLIKLLNKEKIYVIGTFEGDTENTIEHEELHALYYLNDEYRNKIKEYIFRLPDEKTDPLFALFRDLGYSHSVFEDEFQAYMGSYTNFLDSYEVPYDKEVAAKIAEIAKPYLEELRSEK